MSDPRIDKRPMATAMTRRFAFPTQTTFLSRAVLLEEAGPPRAPALICLLGFAFVVIALLAGTLIQIDVVTNSPGRIQPAGGHHILQSFDGGIVDHVMVETGQIVQAGAPLLVLNDPEARAQLDRLSVREAALFAQVNRLQALVALPSTTAIKGSFDTSTIVAEQMAILRLENDALATEQALVQAEIDRRSQTLLSARNLEDEAARRKYLLEDKLRTDQKLYANGLMPKSQLLETEQEAIDAVTELTEIQGQIRDAEAGFAESRRRLDNIIASRRQRQGDQLSSVLIELNETRQQIEGLRRRLRRTQITSPTNGIVMDLRVQHPGQTVKPGDPLVELIPINDGLVAETRLPPSEISHVREGQPVKLVIDGIEPHRHGYLEGIVATISPSTFVDEQALPYYRTTIQLASDSLGGIPLTPGMTVQAQIKTGQRTILEYLLKPVYRAWNTAFTER